MELQSVFKGWDSLDMLYGRCLNRFGTKARANCEIELKMQMLPCFANGRWFYAMGGLRAQRLMFLAQRDVRNLFQMFSKVGFHRCSSCVILDMFLIYEAKVDKWCKAGLYRLSISLHTMLLAPQVCGFDFLHKIWLNAQGCSFDIKQDLNKNGNVAFSI